MTLQFSRLVPAAELLMGVKAVLGRSQTPVMCFSSRGDALGVAQKALTQPYLIVIGGGGQVTPDLRGRALEVVRVTGVYGNTTALVREQEARERLAQWPFSVALLDVYSIVGEPLLVDDLGFPDRRILANAFARVVGGPADMSVLWEALASRQIEFRRDVAPLDGFRDPQKLQLCGSLYPMLRASSPEGKQVLHESKVRERDGLLASGAKELNRQRHGGLVTCEACELADRDAALFDAHHLQPLAEGIRETLVDHLAVLCPTCHRWAHVKAPDRLQPMSIAELRKMRAEGRD